MILVKGKHEAIISEEVFDKVHEKLASKVLNRADLLVEISTYVALLNAQNAEIIWYVDGRIIKRKSPKNGQSSVITFVPYSIVQGVLHVTVIPSMLKSSSV